MISSIKEVTDCPDCGSGDLRYSEQRDQVICKECGLIFEPLTPLEEEKFERSHKAPAKPVKAKPKPKKRKR